MWCGPFREGEPSGKTETGSAEDASAFSAVAARVPKDRAALSGEGARMNGYAALCDFRNLYRAHLRARKGKRGTAECIAFEMELPQNLSRLQEELRSRT